MTFIKPLNKISKKDVSIAGGKGANLGEMAKAKIPVPPGFVVLTSAFGSVKKSPISNRAGKFLKETNIQKEIEAMWKRIDIKDIESVEENSKIIRDLILKGKMPKEIEFEILTEFQKLKSQSSKVKTTTKNSKLNLKFKNNFFVAVRSSATAEDSKIDSWAGELESYLNTTEENLIENIKKCWASLYAPRALFYRVKRGSCRTRQNLSLKNLGGQEKISVAVVIQKMIQSEVSGVCFTAHPVTKNKNQMVIEAVWELGESLVSGKVTPDNYVIEKAQNAKLKTQNHNSKLKTKRKIKILDVNVSKQKKMIVRDKNSVKEISVPKSKQLKQKLSEKQIKELAKLCLKIEKHYKSPQDIEWALENGKFFIVQTRPITTL